MVEIERKESYTNKCEVKWLGKRIIRTLKSETEKNRSLNSNQWWFMCSENISCFVFNDNLKTVEQKFFFFLLSSWFERWIDWVKWAIERWEKNNDIKQNTVHRDIKKPESNNSISTALRTEVYFDVKLECGSIVINIKLHQFILLPK